MEKQTRDIRYVDNKGLVGAVETLHTQKYQPASDYKQNKNFNDTSLKVFLFNELNSSKAKFQKIESVISLVENNQISFVSDDLIMIKEFLQLLKFNSFVNSLNFEGLLRDKFLESLNNLYIQESEEFHKKSLSNNIYPWKLKIEKCVSNKSFAKLLYFDEKTKQTGDRLIKERQLFLYYNIARYGEAATIDENEYTVIPCLELEKYYETWIQEGYLKASESSTPQSKLSDAWGNVSKDNFGGLLYKSSHKRREQILYAIKLPQKFIQINIENLDFLKKPEVLN